MLKKSFIFPLFALCFLSSAKANYLDNHLKKMKWGELDVVWLEDNTSPTYHLQVYFDQGALQDRAAKAGETQLMFAELRSGTTRYSKKEILDALEFYGASHGARVYHEFTTYSISGLVKDILPTTKMVCHLFKNATFPVKEFKKTKTRVLTSMKSIVNNHGALANKVFRAVSLKGTGYETPVAGTMRTVRKIQAKDLSRRLDQINKTGYKRIYIKGPKGIDKIANVFEKDCGWTKQPEKRTVLKMVDDLEKNDDKLVYFVSVAKANQAQIRLGRYMDSGEVLVNDDEVKRFASKYIGGGFTSRLMQELRVKRGLVYSAGAYASDQKMYGRAGISTYTKNETLIDALKVINQTVSYESSDMLQHHFDHSKKFVKGSYLFGLESSSDFLETLVYYDHIGKDYKDIYKFQQIISKTTIEELKKMIDQLFNFENQTKLILGNPSLIKVLKKAGYKVKKLKFSQFI